MQNTTQFKHLSLTLARAVFNGYLSEQEADEIFDYAENLMEAKGKFELRKIEKAFNVTLS